MLMLLFRFEKVFFSNSATIWLIAYIMLGNAYFYQDRTVQEPAFSKYRNDQSFG